MQNELLNIIQKIKKMFVLFLHQGISVSDLLGKYIPNSQIDSGAQLIEWKDGR